MDRTTVELRGKMMFDFFHKKKKNEEVINEFPKEEIISPRAVRAFKSLEDTSLYLNEDDAIRHDKKVKIGKYVRDKYGENYRYYRECSEVERFIIEYKDGLREFLINLEKIQ